MTVAYRASGAAGKAAGAGLSITVTIPSGVKEGDLVLASCITDTQDAYTDDTDLTDGWYMLYSLSSSLDADHTWWLWARWATAADEAAAGTGSWTLNLDADDESYIAVIAYSGVDTIHPFLGPVVWGNSRNVNPATPAASSPEDDTLWVVGAGCNYGSGAATISITVPSGTTERINSQHQSGSRTQRIAIADQEIAAAGAHGIGSWTFGTTAHADGFWWALPLRAAGQGYTVPASFDAAASALSPLRLYKFNEDEASPATVVDHGSDGEDGTATYSVGGYVDGPAGEKVYKLGAAGEAVKPTRMTDESITVVAIGRLLTEAGSSDRSTLVMQSTSAGGSNDGWAIHRGGSSNSGTVYFRVNGTTRAMSTPDPNAPGADPDWYFHTFVLDVVNGHQWGLDGFLAEWASSAPWTTDPDLALNDRALNLGADEGSSSANRYWRGEIARIAIFNGALDENDLATLRAGWLVDIGEVSAGGGTAPEDGAIQLNGAYRNMRAKVMLGVGDNAVGTPQPGQWVAGAVGTGLWDDGVATDDGYQWASYRRGFLDVSAYVKNFKTRMGRSGQNETFPAGSAVIRLDNDEGHFSLASGAAVPGEVPIQVGQDIYVLMGSNADASTKVWQGRVRELRETFGHRGKAVVDVVCSDALADLAQVELPPGCPWQEGDGTDTAMDLVLDAAGWPNADTHRLFDATMNHTVDFLDCEGLPALDVMRRIAQAEGGAVYADREGRVAFRERDWLHDTVGATADLTIGATGTGSDLEVRDIGPLTRNLDRVINVATMRRLTGYEGHSQDPDSVGAYGTRAVQREVIAGADWQADTLASRLVTYRAEPQRDYRQITVRPANLTQLQALLALDIGDVIRVTYTHPVESWVLQVDSNLVGVAHSVDRIGTHTVTLQLDSTYQEA